MRKKAMVMSNISDVKEMLCRLTALRKEKKIKEGDVAERLGIERDAYIRKEKGLTGISVKEWLALSDILEVKLIYFLKDNG